jgi:scyllo-inositol 2-dehydrogenase (NADP+)
MPLRLAAIGLGWVTMNRHIPALRRHPAWQLAGVIGRQPGRAADVARRYGLSCYADTYDLSRVEWLDGVDAVAIGAAPMEHAGLAKAALARGKHVLVEKPFAMTREEGEAILTAARASNRVLAVVHNLRFSRGARKLAADLAGNRLGPLRRISAVQMGNPRRKLPAWYGQLPLGPFYDESPHFFYLLRWLAGGALRLQHAHAAAAPDGKADTPAFLSLLYRSADNLPVTIDCQYDSAVSEGYIMVTGERALGIFDLYRDIYLRLPNDGTHGLPQVLRTSACAISQHVAQHVSYGIACLRNRLDYGNDEVFDRFARAIRGESGALSGMGADDAIAVLRLQHEALDALGSSWLR